MSRQDRQPGESRQAGMASIIITLVTMVVISLIVLGFAAVSRREQRQTLDQQLSTQAFYAAETAVEDARNVIKTRLANGDPLADKTQCTDDDQSGGYPDGAAAMTIDATNNVSYACLLVDLSPDSLVFDGVGTDNVVVPIRAVGGNINRIEIEWQPENAPATGSPDDCPADTVNSFSQQTGWQCGYGLLRADLTPAEGALTSAGLANGTLYGYFMPTSNGSASGSLSYVSHSGPAPGNAGRPALTAASCDTGSATSDYGNCRINITNLNGIDEFMLRLSSLYRTSNVTIRAYQPISVDPVDLIGSQAIIDATGKAQDVLRRVQVRLPLTNNGTALPGVALQSAGSVCKRFNSAPNYFEVADDINEPDPANRMCDRTVRDIP